MTNLKEVIIDAITGEKTELDYSPEQIAETEKNAAIANQLAEKAKEAQIAKAALLEKLGITAEEAALLLS